MTPRRIAANRVVVDGVELVQCAVELDVEGFVANYYTFTGELPFTEWRGGTLHIGRDGDGRLVVIDG